MCLVTVLIISTRTLNIVLALQYNCLLCYSDTRTMICIDFFTYNCLKILPCVCFIRLGK